MPLTVLGSLHLDAPSGRSVSLRGGGDGLALNAQDLSDLRGLAPGGIRTGHRTLASVAAMLRTFDLALDVSIAGRNVMQLGAVGRPNWLARWLRVPCARISLRDVVAAALRSRAGPR